MHRVDVAYCTKWIWDTYCTGWCMRERARAREIIVGNCCTLSGGSAFLDAILVVSGA